MKTIFAASFTALALLSFSSPADASSSHLHHPLTEGGRKGLHGMVLVGAGPYFLEHIPMLTPPHDFQIITEVRLVDAKGAPITKDFSKAGFTLKPAKSFSLNDYISGTLQSFQGAIFEGGFEQGGEVLPGHEAVTVIVTDYKLARQLPLDSNQDSFSYTDGKSQFQSSFIQPSNNVQRIENLTHGEELWCVKGPDFFDPCET